MWQQYKKNRQRGKKPKQGDLETIMDYTLDRWGKAQGEDYLEGLEKLAQHLVDGPGKNAERRDSAESTKAG